MNLFIGALNPTAYAWAPPTVFNASGVSGGAGSITYIAPDRGVGCKRAMLYLSGYTGTNAHTFDIMLPVAFSSCRVSMDAAVTATVTVLGSVVNVVATAQTGWIILEGW